MTTAIMRVTIDVPSVIHRAMVVSPGNRKAIVLRIPLWTYVPSKGSTPDLGEQENLAAKEPAIRGRLAAELGRFLASVGAQMPRQRADGQPVPIPGGETPR